MSHQPNWQEYGVPAVRTEGEQEPVKTHDAIYGTYVTKPSEAKQAPLPANPNPFNLKQ